jgi:hypothetical protein
MTATSPSTQIPPLRELEPAELGAWRGMLRVHSALVKALDAELLATHGLPLTSYEVLINLQAAPGRRRRMAELADGVLLSRSGTTRLVDRLERDGLLVRDTCDSDGRVDRSWRGGPRTGPRHAPRGRPRALPAALLPGRAGADGRLVEPRAARRRGERRGSQSYGLRFLTTSH